MDLELVSTDDLVAELQRRHDATVFVGMKASVDGSDDFYQSNWKGATMTVAGLCSYVQRLALVEHARKSTNAD